MERVGFGFSAHYPSFEPCSEQVKGHQEIPATCLNKPLFGEFISRNKAVLMQANQEGDRMNTLKGLMMPSGEGKGGEALPEIPCTFGTEAPERDGCQ